MNRTGLMWSTRILSIDAMWSWGMRKGTGGMAEYVVHAPTVSVSARQAQTAFMECGNGYISPSSIRYYQRLGPRATAT